MYIAAMKKRSGLLLSAVFLSVQILSILHLAQYGFEQHQHNGHLCEIFIHNEKTQHADVPLPLLLTFLPVLEARLPHFASVILSKRIYKGALSRAPPAYILS